MQSFSAGLNGLLSTLVQGLTECIEEERALDSQPTLEEDKHFDDANNEEDADGSSSDSEDDTEGACTCCYQS